MICVECGEAFEFAYPAMEKLQENLADKTGFKILWHRHELFGRCQKCEIGRPRESGLLII